MKKRANKSFYFIPVYILFTLNFAVAQNPVVAVSKDFKVEEPFSRLFDYNLSLKIAGASDKLIYAVKFNLKKGRLESLSLESYDRGTLAFDKSVPMELIQTTKWEFTFEKVYYRNNKIVLLVSDLNEAKGYMELKAITYNTDGKFSGSPVILLEAKNRKTKTIGEFKIEESSDHSKFVALNLKMVNPSAWYHISKVDAAVFDKDLKIVWTETIDFKTPRENYMTFMGINIDNDGNLFVTGSCPGIMAGTDYADEIHYYNWKKKSYIKKVVQYEGKDVSEGNSLIIGSANEMAYLAFLYKGGGSYYENDGVLLFEFSGATEELKPLGLYHFKELNCASKKPGEKPPFHAEYSDAKIKTFEKSGDYLYVTATTKRNSPNGNEYYHGKIINCIYDLKNKSMKGITINKRQVQGERAYVGYTFLTNGQQYKIIYNDSKNNLNSVIDEDIDPARNFKKCAPYSVISNIENCSVQKTILQTGSFEYTTLLTAESFRISENEIVMPAETGDEMFCFVKISY